MREVDEGLENVGVDGHEGVGVDEVWVVGGGRGRVTLEDGAGTRRVGLHGHRGQRRRREGQGGVRRRKRRESRGKSIYSLAAHLSKSVKERKSDTTKTSLSHPQSPSLSPIPDHVSGTLIGYQLPCRGQSWSHPFSQSPADGVSPSTSPPPPSPSAILISEVESMTVHPHRYQRPRRPKSHRLPGRPFVPSTAPGTCATSGPGLYDSDPLGQPERAPPCPNMSPLPRTYML